VRLAQSDPLVEAATFGKEVEFFLQSNIGDHLIKRSEDEIQAAVAELKTVSSWRRRRIQDLQNKIQIAEKFQLWLGDAIAQGHQAIALLEEQNAS
jgi:hypothetical protein